MVKHKDYVLNIEKKKKEKNISLSHQFSLNFFAFVLITIMPNERFLVNTNENIYEIGKKNSLIEWLNFNYVLRGKKKKVFFKTDSSKYEIKQHNHSLLNCHICC